MTILLHETDLTNVISTLLNQQYRIIAPTHDEDQSLLLPITHSSHWHRTYQNTRNSIKDFLFPIQEELFQFTRDGEIFDTTPDTQQTVFWGIRPCDAQAIHRLDLVFQSTQKDEYYMAKRQASILVGLACNTPHTTCFCTSLTGGPHNTLGLDILLTQLDDRYLLDAVSDKGQLILDLARPISDTPSPQQLHQATQLKQQAEAQIVRKIDHPNLIPQLQRSFDTDYWKETAQLCISCGICTFLCPTCHCFNITDEEMHRVRFWDSCQFQIYSRHANGHNPRSQIYQRLRNRILHKFLYFQQNFSQYLCVGCGRCTLYCPMHLDLTAMVSNVNHPGDRHTDG